MNFLKNTRDDILTLEADNSQELKWYLDAAFAVHPAMKSHTSTVFKNNPTQEALLNLS